MFGISSSKGVPKGKRGDAEPPHFLKYGLRDLS